MSSNKDSVSHESDLSAARWCKSERGSSSALVASVTGCCLVVFLVAVVLGAGVSDSDSDSDLDSSSTALTAATTRRVLRVVVEVVVLAVSPRRRLVAFILMREAIKQLTRVAEGGGMLLVTELMMPVERTDRRRMDRVKGRGRAKWIIKYKREEEAVASHSTGDYVMKVVKL